MTSKLIYVSPLVSSDLQDAIEDDSYEIFAKLVHSGADLSKMDVGTGALHLAASRPSLNMTMLLLSEVPRSTQGMTEKKQPLASRHRVCGITEAKQAPSLCVSMMQALVEAGADFVSSR